MKAKRLETPLRRAKWLLLLSASMLVACGDSGGASGSAALTEGHACDPSFEEDCPHGLCRDVVGGESCDSVSCQNWDSDAIVGTICTRSCDGDSDCAGMQFAALNGEQVSSETWTCVSGLCHVEVTPEESEAYDPCEGCGGALCSGNCIGCPQCS